MDVKKSRLLEGKRIVNTRSMHQAQELTDLLRDAGAIVLELPTIRIEPPEDLAPLDTALNQLNSYDWIIFTSINSVKFFIKRFNEQGKNITDLHTIRIGAVGSSTKAKLEDELIQVDFQPESFTSEAVLNSLRTIENLRGKRILLPRSDIAPKAFVSALIEQGAIVDEVTVYRTEMESKHRGDYLKLLRSREIDMITFTSSSTFENLMNLLGRDNFKKFRNGFSCASIGSSTSKTMNQYTMIPDVEAEEHTIGGLVKAIIRYYNK